MRRNNILFNFLIRIISSIIPNRAIRKKIRTKFLIYKGFQDNYVYLIDKNNIKRRIYNYDIKGLDISFKGKNNTVILHEEFYCALCCIMFCGDNSYLKIGKNFSANDVEFHLLEDNSYIEIGDNCLVSWDINIYSADGHSIIEKGNLQPCNKPKPVIIGDNVWIGAHVKITKGSIIPDNTVIGLGAIVSGKFEQGNILIAGNPAKIIKRNIIWNIKTTNNLIETDIIETLKY